MQQALRHELIRDNLMNTYPSLTFDEHIERLVIHLKQFIPNVRDENLLFYDSRTKDNGTIEKIDLMERERVELYFEQLCNQGREWINLAGDGWFGSNFLVSVEYAEKTGFSMTAINISGPSLNINGEPIQKSSMFVKE